jgi:plasmid maintenance system antidote protein VapI
LRDIERRLEYRWITWKDFATIIWKSVSELSELLNWKRNLTAKWAILLSTSLNVSAEFWLWLQKDYDLTYEIKKSRKHDLELVKERAISMWIFEVVK